MPGAPEHGEEARPGRRFWRQRRQRIIDPPPARMMSSIISDPVIPESGIAIPETLA